MQSHLIIKTVSALKEYLHRTLSGDLIIFDTERTGLKKDETLLMVSLYDKVHSPAAVVIDSYIWPSEITLEIFIYEWLAYLNRTNVEGIAHNYKFDMLVFEYLDIPVPKVFTDTALMIHAYNPDLLKKLETRVKEDLKIDKPTYEQIIGKKWDKINWVKDVESGLVTPESMGKYACEDVYYTGMIFDMYYPLVYNNPALKKVMEKIEVPLIYVLKDMQKKGVCIDVPFLKDLETRIEPSIKSTAKEIFDIASCEFNLNAPLQKAAVLFDKMKLPSVKATAKGGRSTDKFVLQELAAQGHEIAEKMLYHSQLETLRSTYISKIPELINDDGRLRCSFHADGARTGRFSSSDPNLQNQPNNTEFPVRAAFVPAEGCLFAIADYSQIEPRIMAHLSGDPKMLNIYREAGDIYIGIANELGITRSAAKVVQLAISYGMGPEKLKNSLGISLNEANTIIARYYHTYSKFSRWKEQTEQFAIRNAYVSNMFGRVRLLPNVRSKNKGLYYSALRQATNTVIQGSAADMIKLSMIALHKRYKEEKLDAHILLQVHDELINEAKIDHISDAYLLMIDAMENTTKLSIPLNAEGKVCHNWAQMKDKSFVSLLETCNFSKPVSAVSNDAHSLVIPTLIHNKQV